MSDKQSTTCRAGALRRRINHLPRRSLGEGGSTPLSRRNFGEGGSTPQPSFA